MSLTDASPTETAEATRTPETADATEAVESAHACVHSLFY